MKLSSILGYDRILKEDSGQEKLLSAEELEVIEDRLDISYGPQDIVRFLNSKAGQDSRVRALLSRGDEDGDREDEAAKITEGSRDVGSLKPTQIEIELTKSIAYPLAKFPVLKKMIGGGVQRIGAPGNDQIIVCGDLIIDGHHRWSSLFAITGPQGEIAAIDIQFKKQKSAEEVLSIIQIAIASTLDGEVPQSEAGGMNVLGKSQDEILKLLVQSVGSKTEAGVILSDEFVELCLQDEAVRKHFELEENLSLEKAKGAIIAKVAENLSLMPNPAKGSPKRIFMPQLDQAEGGVEVVLGKLEKGEVNYKAPFLSESKSRKLGSRKLESRKLESRKLESRKLESRSKLQSIFDFAGK